jgi:hypothetical protein
MSDRSTTKFRPKCCDALRARGPKRWGPRPRGVVAFGLANGGVPVLVSEGKCGRGTTTCPGRRREKGAVMLDRSVCSLALALCVSLASGRAHSSEPSPASKPKEPPAPAPEVDPELKFEPLVPITDPRTKAACLERKIAEPCDFDGLKGVCQGFDCVWDGEPDPDFPAGSTTYYACIRCAVPSPAFIAAQKAKEAEKGKKQDGAEQPPAAAATPGASAGSADGPVATAVKATEAGAAGVSPTGEPAAASGAPPAEPEAPAAPETESGGCGAGSGAGLVVAAVAGLAGARRRRRSA